MEIKAMRFVYNRGGCGVRWGGGALFGRPGARGPPISPGDAARSGRAPSAPGGGGAKTSQPRPLEKIKVNVHLLL